MIGVGLIIVVGTITLSFAVLALIRSASLEHEAEVKRLHEHESETLAYDVPSGQDPAEVIVALGGAGYPAAEDTGSGRGQVLIFCPEGRNTDRARVRAVLDELGASGARHATFADER